MWYLPGFECFIKYIGGIATFVECLEILFINKFNGFSILTVFSVEGKLLQDWITSSNGLLGDVIVKQC